MTHVLVGEGDQCWVWVGGYSCGRPTFNRRLGPSHFETACPARIIWEGECGPVPEGLRLRRTCPHVSCVNPAHRRVAHPRQRGAPKLPGRERFWTLIEKTDGCWLWRGIVNNKGYGRIWVDGAYWLAHRYSYYLANGRIPRGLLACHRCDTPLCVNPDHIFMGTPIDNMRDMREKGRQGRRGRNKKTLARLAA